MPAQVIGGRRAVFAGDDLRGVASAMVWWRLLQLMFILPLLVPIISNDQIRDVVESSIDRCLAQKFFGEDEYTEEDAVIPDTQSDIRFLRLVEHAWELLVAFLVSCAILALAGLLVCVPIRHVSGTGSPTETEKRKSLPYLLHFHIFGFSLLRVFVMVLGWAVLAGLTRLCVCTRNLPEQLDDDSGGDNTNQPRRIASSETGEDFRDACDQYANVFVSLFAILQLTLLIDFAYVAISYFVLLCRRFPKLRNLFSVKARWACFGRCCCGCLSLLTCCRVGGRESLLSSGDMQTFASVLAFLFDDGEILDVTASDILAGFYAMRLIHVHYELRFRDDLLELYHKHHPTRSTLAPSTRGVSDKGAGIRRRESVSAIEAQKSRFASTFLSTSFRSGSSRKAQRNHSFNSDTNEAMSFLDLMTSGALSLPSRILTERVQRLEPLDWESLTLASSSDKFLVGPTYSDLFGKPLDPRDSSDRFAVAEGARFIWMAEAIYVWSRSNKETRCKWASEQGASSDLASDLAGRSLEAAPIPGVKDEDLVYAQYKEGIVTSPYVVLLDHEWKSVVVVIRGTLTLEDLMADLLMIPQELSRIGDKCGFDGEHRYAHSGMIATCEWLYDDLERTHVLDKLLDGKYQQYELRITGHSLGAGCALLLSVMLRNKFPTLRCVAFSPPGCTMSPNLGEECSAYCTSFVLDSDVIARCSVESFAAFQEELLETIARIQIPKYRVYKNSNIDKGGISKEALGEFLSEALCDASCIPPSDFFTNLQRFREYRERQRENRPDSLVSLKVPGNVVQLIRTHGPLESKHDPMTHKNGLESFSGQIATARWAEPEEFDRVALTPHLLSDHQTANVRAHLMELAQRCNLQPPYASVLKESMDFSGVLGGLDSSGSISL